MSKTLLDAPIYINTYRLAGIVYDMRFIIPKRDRAVIGERMLDSFGRFLGWNPQKMCFCVKPKFTLKRVLERKYKVRL